MLNGGSVLFHVGICYKLFSNIDFKSHERPIQTKKLTIVKKITLFHDRSRHIFHYFITTVKQPFLFI